MREPNGTSESDWFLQRDLRDSIARDRGEWTVLYESRRSEHEELTRYCALSPVAEGTDQLKDSAWGLYIGDHLPSISVSWDGDEKQVEYGPGGGDGGLEALVRYRNYNGMRRGAPELAEDFRLFHNLWSDPSNRLCTFDEIGNEIVVVELGEKLVRVKTRFLRQYQAVRQMDLLALFECVRQAAQLPEGVSKGEEEIVTEDTRAYIGVGDYSSGDHHFSRFMGKRIVPAPPIETCGMWPFDEKEQKYPEFVIGVDDDGEPLSFSCDPEQLANYFGKNPQAPHYLTPVYFSPSVLSKYYDRPEVFTIDDGRLTCGSLWGMSIDNNGDEHVMAYLGDLGRDLPEQERLHWLTHCKTEGGRISETALRRDFFAQFADASASDLVFRRLYTHFSLRWEETHGWTLFRKPSADDTHILETLRIPPTDSAPEFERQILNLTRLMADLLNEKEIVRHLVDPLPEGVKGIGKLELWLRQEHYTELDRDIKYLRQLQDLRSKGAAHSKGSNYQKSYSDAVGSLGRREAVVLLVDKAVEMLTDMEAYFT